jgi:hypothetical protein
MTKVVAQVLSLLATAALVASFGGGPTSHDDAVPQADPYWCC